MIQRQKKDCWHSRLYSFGRVVNINGIAHTRIHGKSQTTKLRFSRKNKSALLDLLDQRIARMLARHPDTLQPEDKHRQPITLKSAIDEFKTMKEFSGESAAVQRWYRTGWSHYLPSDSPMDYKALYRHIDQCSHTIDHMDSTRRKHYQYLRKFFDWCLRMEYIDKNPFALVEIPKAPKKEENHIYSPDEVMKILEHFDGDDRLRRMGLYLQLLNHTAMRPGEALKLQWSDILDDQMIIDGKGGERRVFPLHSPIGLPVRSLLDALRHYMLHSTEGRLFPWNNTVPILEELKIAKKLAGIRDTNAQGHPIKRALHTFRATCEWRWKNQYGLSPETIADLAGHSIAIHERHYRTIPTAAELSQAIDREAVRERAGSYIISGSSSHRYTSGRSAIRHAANATKAILQTPNLFAHF